MAKVTASTTTNFTSVRTDHLGYLVDSSSSKSEKEKEEEKRLSSSSYSTITLPVIQGWNIHR